MNYDIIFYHSGKTAELEKILASSLEGMGLYQRGAAAAADPEELSDALSDVLKKRKLIIIIGGMDGGIQSTDCVLADVLSDKNGKKPEAKPVGTDGRIMCSSDQTIVLLPDSGEDIRELLPELKEKLAKIYDLSDSSCRVPEIDNVTGELDEELSRQNRERVAPVGMTAEKRNRKQLDSIKLTIAVLLVLAALQLAAASYIFLNYM